MKYVRMPIEIESPEEQGYDTIRYNLSESSMRDRKLSDLGLGVDDLVLAYGAHRGAPGLLGLIAANAKVGDADVLCTAGAAAALFIIATTVFFLLSRLLYAVLCSSAVCRLLKLMIFLI